MQLPDAHFLQVRHLPEDYEISFADSVRLNADVHKVFFALEKIKNVDVNTWKLG